MSTINFSTPFTADKIDAINGVIRGVSVITSGLIARGHDLEVDDVTLRQMKDCADAKNRVPVKVNHKSGAEAVCGWLTNFRREENKLKADWFLLESHPQRNQILEVARRMPEGVGLSASFLSPDKPERTKSGKNAARCEELISVDYVTLPAANPDGMFAARTDRDERPMTGVDRAHRVIGAASRGAEIGVVGGLGAKLLLRRRRINTDGAAAAGAAVGAIAGGLYQYRKDRSRDLAARVETIVFQQRTAVGRLIDATNDNVSVPIPGEAKAREIAGYAENAKAAYHYAKKPLVRRVAGRALKIGVGAGLGYYAGRRLGSKAGAVTGAVAGLLFSNPDVHNRVSLSLKHAKKVTAL